MKYKYNSLHKVTKVKIFVFILVVASVTAFFGRVEAQDNQEFQNGISITWRTAIRKLCRENNWTRQKTFKKCLTYAKKKNFIQKNLKIRASQFINSEELTALIKKSSPSNTAVVTEPPPPQLAIPPPPQSQSELQLPSPPPPPPPPPPRITLPAEIPPRQTVPLTFSPFPTVAIEPNFFSNVLLSSPLPNNFYRDEVYFIEGDFIGVEASEAFVFLCRDGQGCTNSINFVEKTRGSHFKIQVHFAEVGNFKMGLIPGRSGQSRVADISVLPEPPLELEQSGGIAPTVLSVNYQEGKTNFVWDGQGTLTRLIIFQGNQRQDYLFRQAVTSFAPASKDFAGFVKGTAFWIVKQNLAVSPVQSISLTIQDFRKIEADKIQILNIRETFLETGRFTFSGKALATISKKAAITLPNGQVREIVMSEGDIAQDQNITIEFDMPSLGTYIFELNNPQGSAVVNIPIYVGTDIPLLPDFFSLNPPKLDPAPIVDLMEARKKLLVLINTDRAAAGLAPVQLTDELNEIAQAHSQNMVNLNFFGHINPAGLSPDDRRKNARIPTPILENLGKATSLELVEAGLMRSPVHRAAILDTKVTRVGLGIVKNQEGYLIITQNFSPDPLRTTDLPAVEDNLINRANSLRIQNNLSSLNHDGMLKNIASQWSMRMANEKFFSLTSPQGDTLVGIARANGITSSIQVNILQTSSKEKLSVELLKQTGLLLAQNLKIGIGLALNEIGEIFMTVVYSR